MKPIESFYRVNNSNIFVYNRMLASAAITNPYVLYKKGVAKNVLIYTRLSLKENYEASLQNQTALAKTRNR